MSSITQCKDIAHVGMSIKNRLDDLDSMHIILRY